jgi:hypothetical protein
MGAGYHESGLGSAEHELYGASAGGGERAWHVGDPDGRLCDEGEVYGSHEADPILFQLLPCLPGDCLWRGFGVELFWRGGRKTKRELRIKFELVPAIIPRKAAIA